MTAPRPLACRQARPYLSALADGELADPLAAAVAAHAATCHACEEILARHRSLAALLAQLPTSEPSPEVLQRVLAARAPQRVGPVARESLRPRPAHSGRAGWRRRALMGAIASAFSPGPYRSRPRPALLVALPALAAVLVLTLALFALHDGQQQRFASSSHSPSRQQVSGNPLTDARNAAEGRAHDLGFQPVLPALVPQGARFLSAVLTPAPALGGAARLDLSWTLSGGLAALHVRESAQAFGAWADYKPQAAPLRLAWQLPGHRPWRAAVFAPDQSRWAVAQSRDDVSLAADVAFAGQSSADEQTRATAENVLRLVTLSMDAPANLSSAPLPPDPSATVVHYSAQGTVNGTQFGWEAYLDTASGQARIDVRDAGGALLYSDVTAGGNLTRFDAASHLYQRTTPGQLPAEAQLRAGVSAFFAAGASYAQAGKLWNVGLAQWQGRTLMRFALTTAPYLTYVYADPNSLRVVGASVDLSAPDHPGTPDGPSQLASATACLSYTLVEYLRPSDVPAAIFDPAPPSGYEAGQPRSTLTCGG